jgi:protein SCO1/2
MCFSRSTAAMVLLACSLAACRSTPSARQYSLEGQILDIRRENNEVLIKHGDIQGFMPGMTMPFRVRNSALLDKKAPGDLVQATLRVESTDAWIETLDKIGSAPLPDSPAAFPAASFVSPLQAGELVPDTTLADQNGETFSLSAWRGAAIALTFIYIRCQLPQFCPLLDRRFVEVQRDISADASLTGRARLLSVSFDPDADTPARLKAHAAKLQANPAIWRFATAPREVIDRFSAQFGVNVIREADSTITHNMRTTVIGPDGRVVATFEGSDWTADQIVESMRHSLAR